MAPTLTQTEEKALQRVIDCKKRSEDHLKPWRDSSNDRYRLYRSVQAAFEHARTYPNDRDEIAWEMAGEWGSDLHIPLAFSTVETVLPRAVSNRPRGLVLPDERSAEESVENMRMLIARQHEMMRYELTNQETAKSGFIFGLGAQKGPYWKREVRKNYRYLDRPTDPQALEEATGTRSDWVVREQERTLWDTAWGDDIDIFDLFWDPFGYDAFSLRWILHRTWQPKEVIIEKLRAGRAAAGEGQRDAGWQTQAALALTAEDLDSLAVGDGAFDSVWKERMTAAGHTNFAVRGDQGLHEVWEYHTRDGELVTILDKAIPVRIGRNPFWHGQMPFHFFRPTTPGIKQLHGIGEIEPIADLIRELNMLRSNRRDNARLVLQQVFAFDEDAIDRDHLAEFRPGLAIPVRSDNPRAHLFPLDFGDVPHSGYREEEEIKTDIDRTTGIADVTAGGDPGASQTATGVQTLAAAANVRIQNKSRRFEVETVTPFTDQQIALNQQMIVSSVDVRVPYEPQPGEIDAKPWRWIKMGPNELKGRMSFVTDAGALQPENPAQIAQQGAALWNSLRDHPGVIQERLLEHFIQSQGVKQPGTWLKPPEQPIPPQVLEAMERHFGPEAKQVAELTMQRLQEEAKNGAG